MPDRAETRAPGSRRKNRRKAGWAALTQVAIPKGLLRGNRANRLCSRSRRSSHGITFRLCPPRGRPGVAVPK